MTGELAEPWRPELVIGLVGAAGTNLSDTAAAVTAALTPYGYTTEVVRLSKLMHEVIGGDFLDRIEDEDERIRRHMDAGDEIRRQANRDDAVAGLAISAISEFRNQRHGSEPAEGVAFILQSLKHPDEVEALRSIYRNRFILISVHSPTTARLTELKKKIAESHGTPEKPDDYINDAEALMERDEEDEEREFGQHVRDTFILGDVYVSEDSEHGLQGGVTRYLRLFFSHPYLTPTKDECAMFQAHAAALRSADLSRQVGAAIVNDDGDVVAVGCNEVPKAFGGQYWEDDENDQRDFVLGFDSNTKSRDNALDRAFQRLQERGQLREGASSDAFIDALKGTRLANITEFGRPMHAEMSALLDAARRGAATRDHQLFTTTFPCHNCARHIIGAGIERLVYREPYEKSLASELHKDAIVVDPVEDVDDRVVFERFVGVGPPRYFDLFTKVKRRDDYGNKLPWSEATGKPRLITTEVAYLANEEGFLQEFADSVANVDLSRIKEGDG